METSSKPRHVVATSDVTHQLVLQKAARMWAKETLYRTESAAWKYENNHTVSLKSLGNRFYGLSCSWIVNFGGVDCVCFESFTGQKATYAPQAAILTCVQRTNCAGHLMLTERSNTSLSITANGWISDVIVTAIDWLAFGGQTFTFPMHLGLINGPFCAP